MKYFIGILLLLIGVIFMGLAYDAAILENAMEGYLIGASIFAYILGYRVIKD